MDSPDLLTLDSSSSIRLLYLAEGAANIVYRPVPPPATPSTEAEIDFPEDHLDGASPTTPPPTELSPVRIDPRLEGKLIRLRKNLSTTVSVAESWDHFHNVVIPLFLNSQIVSQTLFKISHEVLRECNRELLCMDRDGRRPDRRRALYLAEDERYGSLISDMSSDEGCVSIEFKPKWLVQSPSAPARSKRCRTCALRAMKQGKAKRKGARDGGEIKGGFCPLNLVSADRSRIGMVVEQLLSTSKYSDIDRMCIYDQLISWIQKSSLLQRLKFLQEDLDPIGVFRADTMSQRFLTAMTLRDCTLFLKIPRSCHGPIEARLGDLDLKSSKGAKVDYWRNIERRLIDEGWYTCTEGVRSEDSGCFLATQ